MATYPTWPSVPVALAHAFYDEFGTGTTQLAYPLELPTIWVSREGGADDGTTDFARVRVVVIASNESEAEGLSEAIRTYLVTTRPIKGGGRVLDKATTEIGPARVPYADSDDPNITQYNATYVVTSRRR